MNICPICSCGQFGTWRFPGLERCLTCGHVRNALLLSEQEFDAIQLTSFGDSFVEHNLLFLDAFHDYLTNKQRLTELKRYIKPPAKVLEVGIGHGGLLRKLASLGYRVEGLDLSPEVCNAVRRSVRVPIHCGSLDDFVRNGTHRDLDMVLMCHVLEHFRDPAKTLDAVRGLLRMNGLLYVVVPNVAAPEARLRGWTGYAQYHVNYFRPKSLELLLNRADFAIETSHTAEPFSGWFNAVVRSIIATSSPSMSFGARTALSNAIYILHDVMRLGVGAMLLPFRWLQAAAGYGEELTMIGRRI